jgi:hypothetical protein
LLCSEWALEKEVILVDNEATRGYGKSQDIVNDAASFMKRLESDEKGVPNAPSNRPIFVLSRGSMGLRFPCKRPLLFIWDVYFEAYHLASNLLLYKNKQKSLWTPCYQERRETIMSLLCFPSTRLGCCSIAISKMTLSGRTKKYYTITSRADVSFGQC